jgi:glyoxylase-like metal-dependent hydrolase (beta-lactamase superfamily II)
MPSDNSQADFIPNEISKAGRYLVVHEGNFCRVGISSNVYVANHNDKHYLFDSSGDPELMKYLLPLGIMNESLGGVFLTHGHYDHVRGILSIPDGGPLVFLAEPDCVLAESCLGERSIQGIDTGREILAQLGLEVVRTPGHTPGSTCFYSKEDRLLISGDTVFSEGFFGRTDTLGGSNQQMLDSLNLLSRMEIDAMLPGHGNPLLKKASESISAALDNARCLLRN